MDQGSWPPSSSFPKLTSLGQCGDYSEANSRSMSSDQAINAGDKDATTVIKAGLL